MAARGREGGAGLPRRRHGQRTLPHDCALRAKSPLGAPQPCRKLRTTFGRALDNKMSRIGLMRGRLLVLVLLCHRVDGLLLTTSPAARLPAPVGGDSPLVRPLEGPDFFDACSTAHVAVVLFHGEKCRSCRAFTPKYSRLAQQYQGQAEFFRVVATRNADLLASEHVATLLPWCAEAESSPVPGLGAGPPTPPCTPPRP